MKYLTLEEIKSWSKIEYLCNDDELTRLGRAAERAVMKTLNRTLDDLIEKEGEDGDAPADVKQATVMLVENFYTHHGTDLDRQRWDLGYGFEFLLKPYMIL